MRWAPQVGLTARAVAARADRERWTTPYEGVVLVPGATWDHRTDLMAAQAAIRAQAAARGLSAAWLYDLTPRPPARPHLLVPHHQRVRAPVGLVRRSRHVTAEDSTIVDGIVTLTPTFWIISTAAQAHADDLLTFAVDARQRGLLAPERVMERLDTMPRVHGRAALLRILRTLEVDGSDSMFESRVRDRLRAAGLAPSSGPVGVQLTSGRTVHLDIAFPRERVAIECIGHVAHRSRRQLNRDALRENAIALSDEWLVLKLTWDRFMHDWDAFVAEVRAALRRRRSQTDHH
jgi:very-short-patch-repair endonuclease